MTGTYTVSAMSSARLGNATADLKASMHSEHDSRTDKLNGKLTRIVKNSLAMLRNRYNARTRKDRWLPFRQPKSYDEEFPM